MELLQDGLLMTIEKHLIKENMRLNIISDWKKQALKIPAIVWSGNLNYLIKLLCRQWLQWSRRKEGKIYMDSYPRGMEGIVIFNFISQIFILQVHFYLLCLWQVYADISGKWKLLIHNGHLRDPQLSRQVWDARKIFFFPHFQYILGNGNFFRSLWQSL